MNKIMTKVFGANWRTTVSGVASALAALLGMFAALPYTMGDVATIIPPAWKSKVFLVASISAFLLRLWNSRVQKDKSVTGGVVQQTANGAVADPVEVGGVSQSVADTIKAEPKQ